MAAADPPATAVPAEPQLPPTNWVLKEGAPPAAAAVFDRAVRRRQREFEAQLRVIQRLEKDLAARKAGRVVKQLKARDGWRVM